MAKVVSLDNLARFKNNLNNILDTIAQEISGDGETLASATGYYKNIAGKIIVGNLYLIGITVATAGTYSVQITSDASLATLITTLIANGSFEANKTRYIIGYSPTQGTERYIRLSDNNVSWSVSIAKLEKNYSYIKQLQDLLLEKDYSDKTNITLSIQTNGYYNIYGNFVSDTTRAYAIVSTDVEEGQVYALSTFIRPASIPAIEFFKDNTFMSYLKAGTGTDETLTDYMFEVPDGCNKIIVQSADYHIEPVLKLVNVQTVSKSYTKQEVNNLLNNYSKSVRKYGIKWSLTDNDDLGQRCFDAEGLSATIGEGSTNGSSDFDNIYPWSEMKRCNIKLNANGAYVVTYEGETGFALDGTNGDVFVRIPKFNVLRYKENGYEYRVIGAPNAPTHEAFIENGQELEEIFVGAFEGKIDNSELKSIAGVIPTCNEQSKTFLTAAQSKGTKYSLYDNRCLDAIWTLLAIEFGCRNTNAIFGYGLADFVQPDKDAESGILRILEAANSTNSIKVALLSDSISNRMLVGENITICDTLQTNIVAQRKITNITNSTTYTTITFDGDPIDVNTDCFYGTAAFDTNFCENCPTGQLSWHTGRALWRSGSGWKTTQNPIRYRWIENLVGNLWHNLPDVCFVEGQMYVCKNMEDYDYTYPVSNSYKAVGSVFIENSDNGNKSDVTGYNYWITSLADETFAKAILFGRSYDKSLTSKKAFGGYYYLYTTAGDAFYIVNGGGFDHLWRCNMLTQRGWVTFYSKWYLYGSRLIFKNI